MCSRAEPARRRRAGSPLLRSLPAAQALARLLRPCYGPHGRRKLLVGARGGAALTGRAAAILRGLQLEHPAARLLRDAAQAQAEGGGAGAGLVVLLAAALLLRAEHLLRAGLARSQLRRAFAAAAAHALALLPALATRSLGALEDPARALRSAVGTHADGLAPLVARACWAARAPDGGFRRERVAVCALPGGALHASCLLPGLAVRAEPCGRVAAAPRGASVALFACDFGPASPRAPATARLASAADLAAFGKGSERLVETQVAQLAGAGIDVAVVWGDVDDTALAQADQRSIMVVRAGSRRDLVHLSDVLDTPLTPHLRPPLKPGRCRRVYQQQLGEASAVVFECEHPGTPAVTLVLRGATAEGLRSAEQAACRGFDAYCQLCQDPRLLPGAGATEMALAKMLAEKGSTLEAPNGPAFQAFASALRSLPEALAENAGLAVSDVMAQMNAAHQAGNFLVGVGLEGIINVAQEDVWDTLIGKAQALRAVADVTLELVNVDEIVVAKKSAPNPQDLNPARKAAQECPSPVKNKFPGT